MSCCTYLNWPFKKQNYEMHENDMNEATSPPALPPKPHKSPNASRQTEQNEHMETEDPSIQQQGSLEEQPHTPITSQVEVNQLPRGPNNDFLKLNSQAATKDMTTENQNNQPNAIDANASRQTNQNEHMETEDPSIQQQVSLEVTAHVNTLVRQEQCVKTLQRQDNKSETHTISTSKEVGQHNLTTETKNSIPADANFFNQTESYSANKDEEYKRKNSSEYLYLQTQAQLQRSLEASKQMLYGTFANVIAILEEFEKREIAQSNCQPEMPTSHVPIPNQEHKNFEDIESIVKTQILLFETQTKYCPREVLGQVKEELIRLTICWTAVRAERDVKYINKTDAYVGKLLEVLVYGNTKHTVPNSSGVSEQVMRDSFMAILQGVHSKNVLDDEFKNDRSRTATAPNIRGSSLIREGAKRIAIARGLANLDPTLEKIVSELESANLK